MLCMLVRLYLSYSLFVRVGLCITLAVLYIRIKVIVMRITLQSHVCSHGLKDVLTDFSCTQMYGYFRGFIAILIILWWYSWLYRCTCGFIVKLVVLWCIHTAQERDSDRNR